MTYEDGDDDREFPPPGNLIYLLRPAANMKSTWSLSASLSKVNMRINLAHSVSKGSTKCKT